MVDCDPCLCYKHYFEELEEESLRDNFVVVYELLDEIMDFGYPQYTEAKILSEFIKTIAYRMEVTQRPPMAVTNSVSWRSEGINYKKNEVFLDVVESVNILVNSNGQLIRSEVVGAPKMRTFLSGMPECKLGLNDRVLLEAQGRTTKGKAIDLEDIKFHQYEQDMYQLLVRKCREKAELVDQLLFFQLPSIQPQHVSNVDSNELVNIATTIQLLLKDLLQPVIFCGFFCFGIFKYAGCKN